MQSCAADDYTAAAWQCQLNGVVCGVFYNTWRDGTSHAVLNSPLQSPRHVPSVSYLPTIVTDLIK